jgi:amino acid adenylation domain-containing protein
MSAPGIIEDVYPLSHMQSGMLFHHRYAPESEAYFEQVSCTIRGELDVALFERAWRKVIACHAVLRSVFDWEEFELPVQVVLRTVSLPLQRHDLRHLPPEAQRAAIEDLEASDRRQKFDLSKPPLMRLMLIRLGEHCHRLIWSHHHILLDGWSVALVANEVFTTYEQLKQGLEIPPEGPRRYRDYIAWLGAIDLAGEERYWRRALAGVTPHPHEERPGDAGGGRQEAHAEYALCFGADETAALENFARRQHITLNVLVQGAWSLVLARTDGTAGTVFGVTVSGRPTELAQIETMVGMFMNTLPLKVEMADDARLLPWLQDLHRLQREIEQHAYVPLADIQKWSGIAPAQPLFQRLLVFENYPLSIAGQRMGGDTAALTVDEVSSFERTSYALNLLVVPKSEMSLTFVYDRRWYAADAIQRMAGHIRAVLRAMIARPEQRLGEISLLTAAERHQTVLEWNDTAWSAPTAGLVHQFIEQQVARTPDSTALVFSDQHVSYAELNRRADGLARRLSAIGVGPEVIVGIFLERSVELPIALLGVLKAGGAYLPLELSHPPHYLAQMLEDSRPLVVLTTAALAEKIPPGCEAIMLVEAADDSVAGPRHDSAGARLDRNNLAYVMYTSGSTGRPKGVMIAHHGVCNRLWWMQDVFRLDADDRFVQKTPIHFDACVWELFLPLMIGASMVLAKPAGHLDASYLSGLIADEQITVVHFVPPLLQRFLDEDVRSCVALRYVLASGEALSRELEQRFFERLDVRMYNLYGPTEASIDVTAFECGRLPARARVPLGWPIHNTEIHILDSALNPLPGEIPGQLAISGAGLARGYLNRPELTAERFVPNPMGRPPGTRSYLSGDQARRLGDGPIEYLGRLDQQIKLRGVRIELAGIEAVLSRHPAVRRAIALLQQDGGGEAAIVAYVACHGRADRPAEDDLRRWVYRHLPRAAVPAAFVLLDEFPLLANGKADRAALSMLRPAAASEVAGQRAHGQVPELLAGIWSRVLGVEPVQDGDDFFALGGHSILAMQMVSRVRELFAVEIELRDVFEAPLLLQLARRIERALRVGARGGGPAMVSLPRDQPLPLSFAQERLWFLDRLNPGDPAFHVVSAIRFRGHLDISSLERSLNEIVRRHEVLRTVFPLRDDKPVQKILPHAPAPVPVLDLASVPGDEKESALRRAIAEEFKRPFSLAEGPLLRAHLIRLDCDDHVGLFVVHHIVFDGWSVGIFNRELAAIYQAFHADTGSPLAELALQYADIADHQRRQLRDDVLASLVDYWRSRLADAVPPARIPADFRRPSHPSSQGADCRLQVPADMVAALKANYRSEGVTLFMILLAAFKVLLRHLTGSDKVVVGSDAALRSDATSESLIGCFLNQIVLFTEIDGNTTFRHLLQQVRRTTLEALAHQDLPFEKLVEALNPPRELGQSPLFQVKFMLLNVPQAPLKLPGLELLPLNVASGVSEFDVLVVLEEAEGAVNGTMKYRKELFGHDTIARMVEMYTGCLHHLAEQPQASLASLKDLLVGIERDGKRRLRRHREQENRRSLTHLLRSQGP